MNYLLLLDFFGVEFKQQIQLNVKAQKSKVGGIASLIILGACLAYLIYVLIQWINFELLPKSSNNMKVEETSSFIYDENENFFTFSYWKNSDNQIDPFTPVNNILIPMGMFFENGVQVETVSFLNEKYNISSYGTLKFGQNKIILKQNFSATKTQQNVREFMLFFVKCNKKYLSEGQTCASEEEFQSFFSQNANFILFKISLKEYNQRTQEFEYVRKSYYFTLDSEIATQGQIFIKQTHAQIDTGMMFDQLIKNSFVQEAQILSMASQTNMWQSILGEKSYFNLVFRLDPVSNELHIVYPKLGEVLAQVGSIANLLLLLRFIILYYNETILENYFIDSVLNFYFSNYSMLKQKEKSKQNSQLLKTLNDQAKQKLVYINIIYELSRIQLFLQAEFGRNKLINSHKLGIQIPENSQGDKYIIDANSSNTERMINTGKEEQLVVDDFFLFSKPQSHSAQNILA